jgi:hypothetical protein
MSARFWWVNHPHTHRWEIDGAYLWFPKRNPKSKGQSESHQNMRRMLPGDVVFSCEGTAIGAVGMVLAAVREASRPPEFGWAADPGQGTSGWLVPVRFMALENPLRLAEHAGQLSKELPAKQAPIRPSGACNPNVLLAAVPVSMAAIMRQLLAGQMQQIVEAISQAAGVSLAQDIAEQAIQQRTDIGPAQKTRLSKARDGQGVYRENLESVEHACRVTGVLDRRHLRAVHIKPWHECDDGDKLNGCNGLLLSPHLAHLFTRGYISFEDNGDLLVSRELNPAVLENWRIQLTHNAGTFNAEQCRFLEFHRREVFQQHGGGRRHAASRDFIDTVDDASATVEPVTIQPAYLG